MAYPLFGISAIGRFHRNKQHWNDDKCRCECKELIELDVCDKGFIWNPSNGEYVDHKNCKCKKGLLKKLAEECTENIEETRLVKKNSTE